LPCCAQAALSLSPNSPPTQTSRQAVTKHLQVLADAGLVKDLKSGRERLWQFDPAQMEEARLSLEMIGRQWEMALGRLKVSLES
jgi:DNA-binding transcriptional ArsR family regulator